MSVFRGYAFYVWRICFRPGSSSGHGRGRRPPDLLQVVNQVRPFVGRLAENTLGPDYFHWQVAIAGFWDLGCRGSHFWPGYQRRGFTGLLRGRLYALPTSSSPSLLRTCMLYIHASSIYVYPRMSPRSNVLDFFHHNVH